MNFIQKHIKNSMNLVHNFSLEEIALLKIIMVLVGILLAKIFPVLLTGNIGVYFVLIIVGSIVLLRNMKWN